MSIFNRVPQLLTVAPSVEVVTLEGTSSSPKFYSAAGVGFDWQHHVGIAGATTSSPNFRSKGWIESADNAVGSALNFANRYQWNSLGEDYTTTYYVRCTPWAGDLPTVGSGISTWITLTPDASNLNWGWRADLPAQSKDGTIRLEIATDSGGSNIIATGYYRLTVSTEP